MKGLICFLVFVLGATCFVNAQNNSLAKGPDVVVKGPIIDNINAHSGSLSAIKNLVGSSDNIERYTEENRPMGAAQQASQRPINNDNDSQLWGFGDNTSPDQTAAKPTSFDVQCYPNPARSHLQVALSNTLQVQIRLVNMIGQIVYESATEAASLTIDVSGLPKGYYLLQMDSGHHTVIRRIEIVQ